MDKPTRPTINSKEVKELAAINIIDDITKWADEVGTIPMEDSENLFKSYAVLAIMEGHDAYEACRYVEHFYNWPADRDLIKIFDKAYGCLDSIVRDLTTEWVMKNAVRFPAKKGDKVVFSIGDAKNNGTVVEIVSSNARGYVQTKQGLVGVFAEEITKVSKGSNKKTTVDKEPA